MMESRRSASVSSEPPPALGEAGGEGNARGRATRAKLLAAGWQLLDELQLGQVFEAMPAREIAERAGSSERTVRHHFADGSVFAEALLEMPLPSGFFGDGADYGSVDALTQILTTLSPAETVSAVRAAAHANWKEVTADDDVVSLRRQLLLLSRLEAHPELRDRMRQEYYGKYLPLFARSYEVAIERAGRRLVEPLTIEQFASTLAALSEGFLLQWMVDPRRVSAEFVAEVCVAVALSLTVPADSPIRSVEDLECTAIAAPSGVAASSLGLAVACHDLFGAGVDTVSWSQVARRCGLPTPTVRSSFPTMRSVAAISFAAHLPAIEDTAARNGHRDLRRPLPDVLCELVRVSRSDRHCADALAAERRHAVADRSDWIMELVPIDRIVGRTLDSGDGGDGAARRMVDVALTLAATQPSAPPAQVAAWAISTW